MKGRVLLAWLAACGGSTGPSDDDPILDAPVVIGDGKSTTEDPAWAPDSPLPAEFDFPPYLNLLDATTVVVSWRTLDATTGLVRFGTTAALGDEAASSTAANLHHVTLSNLVAGSAYHYEVEIDGSGAKRAGVFVMPGRMQWRFVHFGEFHAPSESANVAKYTEYIRAFRPHVILESGDMVDDGNSLAHWRNYMQTSAPWISNTLLLPAHSNHVNGPGGNTLYKDIFAVGNNERWYTTRYGQAEMFSIDSTFAANNDVMTVEVPWVASNAALAHDGDDDPLFVIGAWHHPACSSQYFSRTGERNWVQTNLVGTFKANGGIDLILAAHDKYYERNTITGGITTLITNIGNISPEIPGGNHADCTVEKSDRSTQSIALFTMDGATMTTKVIDETGAEIDAFTIAK